MEDFCKHYNQMSFCHRVEGMQGSAISSQWFEHSAGGCDKYPRTFLNNPQVNLRVAKKVL